ncbi:MAG: HAD family hydrolase [Hyphomicrobiaceae bacterium]
MNKVVVFDVGGVLLDWNPRYLYRKLLPDDATIEAFFDEVGFSAWNISLDAGRNWDEAVAELGSRFPHRQALIEAAHFRWFDMVSGPIIGTVEILEALNADDVPLYAITNFSSEKWIGAKERFAFLNHFRDTVVSGDEKITKPDPAIYECLLQRNSLEPENCVFIDDSAANVASATAIGIPAIQFKSPAALRNDLVANGFSL